MDELAMLIVGLLLLPPIGWGAVSGIAWRLGFHPGLILSMVMMGVVQIGLPVIFIFGDHRFGAGEDVSLISWVVGTVLLVVATIVIAVCPWPRDSR